MTTTIKPRPAIRLRDSQRSAVYDWERKCYPSQGRSGYDQPTLSREEALWLIEIVFDQFNVPAPTVEFAGAQHIRAWASNWDHHIKLPDWAVNGSAILHESAHILVPYVFFADTGCPEYASHGPEFASLLAYLFDRFLGVDERKMRLEAEFHRPRRVKVSGYRPQAEDNGLTEEAQELAQRTSPPPKITQSYCHRCWTHKDQQDLDIYQGPYRPYRHAVLCQECTTTAASRWGASR